MGTITLDGVSKEDLELTGDLSSIGLTKEEVSEGVKKGFESSKFVVLTQAEYDALTPESDVFYAITD